MDHETVGRIWNDNAEAWTTLARAGFDLYRDHLNTPAFFELLPDVRGLSGLDIGCGEGHNTRLLAERTGGGISAVDISEVFIGHARTHEAAEPRGIDYHVASAVSLPFPDATFDFATAFMSLMDIPETEQVVAEAYRVLAPGGFLQFSICHPCFDTPHRRNLRGDDGLTYAIEVGEYFRDLDGQVSEWLFSNVPPEIAGSTPMFRVPRFTRTISQWLNLLLDAGFVIERMAEPRATDETVAAHPALQDTTVVAFFLHVRVRK